MTSTSSTSAPAAQQKPTTLTSTPRFLLLEQTYRIPAPTLTEKNLPDQSGKVHIVTGGYAGVGQELCKILYGANAKVYVAGRSASKAAASIAAIKALHPNSTGALEFLEVDLSNFATIKPAVTAFLAKEQRLDVLTNNAGVMVPPKGSVDAHGHELQLGTNVLGPYLFTKLLTPILEATARTAPPNSVRVTWASSSAAYIGAPKGGVSFDAKDPSVPANLLDSPNIAYANSKAANNFLAAEFARRHAGSGIISLAQNPGNLQSELQRHLSAPVAFLLKHTMLHPTIMGAYTELWAGWAPEVGTAENGRMVVPWGRIWPLRKDVQQSLEDGAAAKLWDYCDKETKAFA